MASAPAPRWTLELHRGPDCLLVKIRARGEGTRGGRGLAARIWRLLEQHFTYRLFVELDEIDGLDPHLIRQLVALARRVAAHGGMLRLCGLSPQDYRRLPASGWGGILPAYRHRDDAIFGQRGHRHAEETRPLPALMGFDKQNR
jgi:hypothetical protein